MIFLFISLSFTFPSNLSNITSLLETYDIYTGERKVIQKFQYLIEAPNWTPDDKYLVFNSQGRLYKILLQNVSEITEISTGFAKNLNNDHVITSDGKYIGISHEAQEDKKSRVYSLPLSGGTPRLITPLAPSYFHGWSPDKKFMAYCAERNENFDIYIIDSEGGKEIQLTNTPGLDDGPEFSPDGQHIWFNSVRSGLMQIWRMNIDGSDQTQITQDEDLNSWFPHISPDGRYVVFISYHKEDIDPGQHLPNFNVLLRLIKYEGGSVKTIVKLFGGQGTINVNSWSPDSSKFAFVSYQF
jgi:Tol biopolymer transport system component